MARLNDEDKTKWTEEDHRLLNEERIVAWLEEMTALSRKYGIRMMSMAGSATTITVIDGGTFSSADYGYSFASAREREQGKVIWSRVANRKGK